MPEGAEHQPEERGPAQPLNPSQERAEINRGLTGDKQPMSDPAAAPLGTDEEAGSMPPARPTK